MLCNKEVRSITTNSHQLLELNHIIQGLLPSMLAQYCEIQSYNNGQLLLETSSASASTQLRFILPRLREKLKNNSQFSALQSINIKVKTIAPKLDRHYSRSTKPVSNKNLDLLRQTASSLSDPDLASSMNRLAETLDRNKKHNVDNK